MNFHDLLINRNEIEEALGLSIQTNSEYEYLNDYSMYEYLDLKDVVCIFLNIHPQNINYYQHPRYDLIYDAIEEAIRNKSINGIIDVDTDNFGNVCGQRIKITHDVAKAWANTYKLNWDVPPYKKIHIDELKPVADNPLQTENASLKAQLEQQAQQIADLQSQLENLKKPDTQAVEYTTIEDNTEKGSRISSPQRAIFSLLVMKCYPNHSTRNELFNAINVELKSNGITTKDLKYPTLDRLIDEDLRINNLSPFPPKIK